MTYNENSGDINSETGEAFDLGAAERDLEATLPVLEAGHSTDVVIVGNHVIKTTSWAADEETMLAEQRDLLAYAAALSREPIAVAPLIDASIIRDGEEYRLRHTQELVRGPSVASLPEAERRQAVAQIVGHICVMSTVEDEPDMLQVGLDAAARNFHVGAGEVPTLVDEYRPLLRKPGSMLLSNGYYEKYFGTKSGAITRLFHSSVSASEQGPGALSPLLHRPQEWMYDALPAEADPIVREAVQAQLRSRFAPFIVSALRNKASFALKR